MRWFTPSADEPELLDWWRPLMALSRQVRAERIPWPVHVDEFEFCGRVDRGSRPGIWVYEHKSNDGEVLVDWRGRTYEFIRYRTGRQLGRFKEIPVRRAVWRARLPDVVEPVAYEEARPRREPVEPIEPPTWLEQPPTPTRRRHLYVVPSPTNLN
jgi:hypothetical protein